MDCRKWAQAQTTDWLVLTKCMKANVQITCPQRLKTYLIQMITNAS